MALQSNSILRHAILVLIILITIPINNSLQQNVGASSAPYGNNYDNRKTRLNNYDKFGNDEGCSAVYGDPNGKENVDNGNDNPSPYGQNFNVHGNAINGNRNRKYINVDGNGNPLYGNYRDTEYGKYGSRGSNSDGNGNENAFDGNWNDNELYSNSDEDELYGNNRYGKLSEIDQYKRKMHSIQLGKRLNDGSADPSPITVRCSDRCIPPGSPFWGHLGLLLQQLVENAPYNNPPHATSLRFKTRTGGKYCPAFGEAGCPDGSDPEACEHCLTVLSNNIWSICNDALSAFVHYRNCWIRYQDHYF